MASALATVQIQSGDGVLTVTLNRPDVLNAFNADMSVELGAALRQAQRDDAVRCVVLTGAGRGFCAGQDLRELQGMTAGGTEAVDLGAHLRDKINPLVLRIRTMEKPVLAAVNGIAAGAGVSFALAADLRVCARSAYFKLAFVGIGLVPDGAAARALVQQVGLARASELCLLGETVSAEDALRMGLVNRVVDDALLAATARELALRLAALPPRALALTKRALNHACTATLDEQLEYEAYLQATAGRTADHREGVAAFLDKRAPRFTGQ
ncbi:MAG: enoyl-CoA hydratase/isomerase family protein [Phycisphaerae bacterium]|nr:enoyl-CoA hydratase/isomerase family protein [Phycisphaerae bacterium]